MNIFLLNLLEIRNKYCESNSLNYVSTKGEPGAATWWHLPVNIPPAGVLTPL